VNPARRWAIWTIIAFWLAVVAVNAPGHLSYDSIVQLGEARSRSYVGHHPPLMSYLMMLFDNIVSGTALFLLFMQALFFGALLIIVQSARYVSPWTPLVIAVVCLHPFVVVYQGIVWKDVLFANLAVFSFALLFAARHRQGWPRHAIYALSLLVAACSGLVRQNGAVALLVLAIALAYLEIRPSTLRAHVGAAVVGSAGAILVMLLVMTAADALIRSSAHKNPENPFELGIAVVMRYDIGAILAANQNADTSFLSDRGLDVPAIRDDAVRYYSADRLDWLYRTAPHFRRELRKLDLSQLTFAWAQLIAENPAAYLLHRFAVFGWMLWPQDISKCHPLHLGINGPADLIAKLDLPQGIRPSDKSLYAYTIRFVETPLYRNGFFLVIAVLLAVILRAGYGPTVSTPVVALLAAVVLFTLSWLVVGVSCDVRYMYFLPLAVFVSIVMASLLEAERAARAAAAARPS
jgi:hypothetical protein